MDNPVCTFHTPVSLPQIPAFPACIHVCVPTGIHVSTWNPPQVCVYNAYDNAQYNPKTDSAEWTLLRSRKYTCSGVHV